MNPKVKAKFATYPDDIAISLNTIRQTIFKVAKEQDLGEIEETLKWGEPSYRTVVGSPVRFDWKAKTPEQFCVYFNCQTSLVATFRELYPNELAFEGNRALVFKRREEIAIPQLSHCLALALNYQNIKNFPLLGV